MGLMSRGALGAVVLALGACAHGGAEKAAERPAIDTEARAAAARTDILNQMTFWAREHAAHPQDLEAARKFAEALRQGGRAERAAAVAREALRTHADDPELLRTMGLALIVDGRPSEALRPLALAVVAAPEDWRARSALGVALDQQGRGVEARQAFREALGLKADEPGVLTNLAVSHLAAGQAAEAETLLRQAAALPEAPPQTRQNLAVALALQGKYEEAEQLMRVDLPPDMAAANLTYLRELVSDPRSWGALRGGSGAGGGAVGR